MFKCKGCGHCCKFFGNKRNKIPVWPWEADKLKNLASEKGFSINIKPVNLFLDKISNLSFYTHYEMDAPCLFLKNNKCSIYDYRPIVCRAFPMTTNPYFAGKKMDLKIPDCKAFTIEEYKEAIKENSENHIKITRKELAERYKKFFGEECFVYSTMANQINVQMEKIIKELIDKEKVKLNKIDEKDYEKYSPMPILDFLIFRGFIDGSKKGELIQNFTDYKKIKKLLEKKEE